MKTLVIHPRDQLLYPSWAWDGNAIVFMRRRSPAIAGIWIAAVADGTVAAEPSWVEISPPQTENSRPRFSPDGGSVYYAMGRAGQRLLVSQKIDKRTHALIDEPVQLVRMPVEFTALTGAGGPYPLISVTPKRLFYSVVTERSNLWVSRVN